MPQLNWNNVQFIITVDIDGHRWVDIFEPHPTLTYNQYRLRPDVSIQFCGVNEPNDSSGRRHNVRGSKARQIAEDWVRGSSAPSAAGSSSSDSSTKTVGLQSERASSVQNQRARERLSHDFGSLIVWSFLFGIGGVLSITVFSSGNNATLDENLLHTAIPFVTQWILLPVFALSVIFTMWSTFRYYWGRICGIEMHVERPQVSSLRNIWNYLREEV